MSRHHMTAEGPVPFTAEEEAARDAEEAAVLAQQANPTPLPAPTKEQLMAELAALTAKIQALE
jgi:hypothetical protein